LSLIFFFFSFSFSFSSFGGWLECGSV
jgi:hypothetical protein